jgi:hypothetical protein
MHERRAQEGIDADIPGLVAMEGLASITERR